MMLKKLGILAFVFILSISSAKAYDFKELNSVWDILFSDYTGELNLKNIFLQSGQVLSEIDDSLKLYHSDSKAFLYKKNKLVATLALPKPNEHHIWKTTLGNLLNKGIEYSPILAKSPKEIEDKIILKITENLDIYSRIEPNGNISHDKITYKLINNVLYVHSDLFDIGFSDYLKKVVLSQNSLEGIILDLRDTRGGNFNEAIKIADLFLDNTLITYRKSNNLPIRYYTSQAGDILNGKPIIILTNEQTASSAEIVTAALGEQSRALVIGTRTYGKNSTQQVYNVNHQKLLITNGAFYTPSGKQISQNGILPKICTGLNNSCIYSDKKEPYKDVYMAIRLIKENLG